MWMTRALNNKTMENFVNKRISKRINGDAQYYRILFDKWRRLVNNIW